MSTQATESYALQRFPDASSLSLFVPSSLGVTSILLSLYSFAFGMRLDQNFLIIALVSAITVAGLTYSYSNALYTTQIGLHRADRAEYSSRKTSSAAEEKARASLIQSTSALWAITFVNGAFFVLFTLLSLGTTSGMSLVYKFVLTSLLPPAIIAFLTEPVAPK
ncbi:hypothetical protein DFJ73DRAFT_832693 [Zopfochytrium polystomum]|nr:hypothetical protein DFJ73DRAFT_832693 [Zopfochytrium polystomum]